MKFTTVFGRLLLIILSLAVALPLTLTSCTDSGTDPKVTSSENTEAVTENKNQSDSESQKASEPVETETAVVTDESEKLEIPDAKFNDYEFKIQTFVRSQHDFDYFGGIGKLSADVMNDAVYYRNMKVEDRLGVIISSECVYAGYKKMADDLKAATASGTKTFDMICTSVNSMTSVALSGGLYNINSFDSVDTGKTWWDESLNDAYSLNNCLYYASGDAVTINYDATYIVRFNQDLAAKNNLTVESLYNTVKNREWTIDKMLDIAADFAADDGVDPKNYDDYYGIVAVNTFVQALWYGSGLQVISKDENDLPVLNEYRTEIQDAYEKISSVFTSTATYNSQPKANRMPGLNHANTADSMLLNGHALFQSTVLESMIRTNDSSTKVGILPIPLNNLKQKNYACIVNPAGFCSGIAFPYTIENPERTSAVVEAIMYFSQVYVRPAYFDTVFQFKVLDDEASYEILNIILESRVAPDLATIYEWGGLMETIQNLAVGGSPSIQTAYTAQSEYIKQQLLSIRKGMTGN